MRKILTKKLGSNKTMGTKCLIKWLKEKLTRCWVKSRRREEEKEHLELIGPWISRRSRRGAKLSFIYLFIFFIFALISSCVVCVKCKPSAAHKIHSVCDSRFCTVDEKWATLHGWWATRQVSNRKMESACDRVWWPPHLHRLVVNFSK